MCMLLDGLQVIVVSRKEKDLRGGMEKVQNVEWGMWEEIWLPVLSHYVWGKNCIKNQKQERERDKK